MVFKETVLLKQYCADMQRCLKVLFDDKTQPIKVMPDVTRIVKKLAYLDWHKNQVESFYLKPLKVAMIK